MVQLDQTASVETLKHNWWAFELRGLAAILFGIMLFVWPGRSLALLVLLFGAYAIVDGIFALVSAVRARGREESWGALVLEGIAGIATGVIVFLWPQVTAVVLLYLIAFWALVTGVLEIISAARVRRTVSGEVFLVLSGVASILFGVLMLMNPTAGALALAWIIGTYAMIFGGLLIGLGFRLRNVGEMLHPRGAEPRPI